MKFTGILMMTVLLQVSISGNSQTVNFSGKGVSLKTVFDAIKIQTGILFFYDASLLRDAKPVTVELRNVSLEAALNEIFKDQPLTWVLEDKTITIIKRPEQINDSSGEMSKPRPIQVKGIITDLDNNPMTDVSVMIKGTKKGTATDKNGKFSIEAFQGDVISVSSISYSPKEVKVEKGEMNIRLQLEVKPLELLLVGGNLNAIKRKADATSVTVLDSKTLEIIPVNTIDQVFRGWVAGTNSFDVGGEPEGFPTLSIRGAGGAISLTTIAVYIDGMEYAGGSGYLSQLDKNNIDRIEIVRGPGAATMYGTGSNGGIIQIFTKKGKINQTTVNFISSAGFIKSKWVENNPFQQMHNLETTIGLKKVALTLGGSYRTAAAYLPDGGEKNKAFYTGAKFNLGKLQANLIARYNVRNFKLSRNPIFDTAMNPRTDIIIEPSPGFTTPAYEWFNVRPTVSRNRKGITETTITGVNLSHRTTGNWVNNLDVGYTINNSGELPIQNGTIPLQGRYISNKNNTTTIRYSNTLSMSNNGNGLAAVIISGAEYKKYSSSQTFTRATAATTTIRKDPDNENYGAFVQVNPSYKNVYLTMGLRYEKNELFKAAWNPRLGLTTNFDTKSLTIKPRISWGKGITSPAYVNRFGSPPGVFTVVYGNPDIKPQSQQGFDYGLEVYNKKGNYKFEAVYYDNILKDMISQQELGPDPTDSTLTAFKYTNVAKVANRGWEFSAEYQIRRFNLRGTFSIMNSTVEDTTMAYLNPQLRDKAPGTRLANLPKHTAGFNLTYHFFKLFGKADRGAVSLNITEVDGVRSLDFRNYYLDVSYGRIPFIAGVSNSYPVQNSPVFRFGLYVDYYIVSDLRFFIQGYNILNSYKYEYSNEYPTHGAAWLFGLKYNFTKANNL